MHALLVQTQVGFTATPYRLRKLESRELYDLFTPVFTRNITDMIKARHLCKVRERCGGVAAHAPLVLLSPHRGARAC